MKTAAPEKLTAEQKQKLWLWHMTTWPHHYPQYPARQRMLRMAVDSCLDWHRAEGKRCVDWLAACRNWIRKDMDRLGYEPYRPPSSTPNPRGKRPFDHAPTELEAAQVTMDEIIRG